MLVLHEKVNSPVFSPSQVEPHQRHSAAELSTCRRTRGPYPRGAQDGAAACSDGASLRASSQGRCVPGGRPGQAAAAGARCGATGQRCRRHSPSRSPSQSASPRPSPLAAGGARRAEVGGAARRHSAVTQHPATSNSVICYLPYSRQFRRRCDAA